MTADLTIAAVAECLEPLSTALTADGYQLIVDRPADGPFLLRIEAGPEACEECLIPRPLMEDLIQDAFRQGLPQAPEVELRYPGEAG
jgi:hypothetical protein